MNSVHQKSPFIFFSIFLLVLLCGLGYIYVRNYTTNPNIFWIDASLKISTNTGGCPPTFPCFETYLLNDDGTILHNDDSAGKLSESKTKKTINKAFDLYRENACTSFYEGDETENYELHIDGNTYEFGEKGCTEMQDTITTLREAGTI
jgi:hypothetical protein